MRILLLEHLLLVLYQLLEQVLSHLQLVLPDLIGNLNLASGSITDSSGSLSFGDENLSTTGTLAAAANNNKLFCCCNSFSVVNSQIM